MHDQGNSKRGSRLRRHVRSNLVGYLALGVALSLAPASAGHLVVRTSDIVKGAVTTPKLRNKAVGPAKIKPGAVRTGKIRDAAVTSAKIINSAVTNEKLANGAVTNAKMADNAVTTATIANGAVTLEKLANSFLRDLTVHTSTSADNSTNDKLETANCPAGKVAVGGSAMVFTSGLFGEIAPPTEVALKQSRLTTGADGWTAIAGEVNPTASNWMLRAQVLCATP